MDFELQFETQILFNQNTINIVDSVDDNGNTKLLWAVFKKNKYLAKKLIADGANVNHENQAGIFPLLWCAFSNSIDMSEILLNNKADPNYKNQDELNSLFVAYFHENYEIVKLLIENKVNLKVVNPLTGMPFVKAVIRDGNLDLIKLIFDEYLNIDEDIEGQTPLGIATEYNQTDIIDYFNNQNQKKSDLDEKNQVFNASVQPEKHVQKYAENVFVKTFRNFLKILAGDEDVTHKIQHRKESRQILITNENRREYSDIEYQNAVFVLKNYLKENPEDLETMRGLFNLYIDNYDVENAESMLEQLKLLSEEQQDLEYMDGRILIAKCLFQDAIGFYEKKIKEDVDDYIAYLGLSLVYFEMDNIDEAIKHTHSASKILETKYNIGVPLWKMIWKAIFKKE